MSFRQGVALLAVIRQDVKQFDGVENSLKVMFESGDVDKLNDELTCLREHAELTARHCSALLQQIMGEGGKC